MFDKKIKTLLQVGILLSIALLLVACVDSNGTNKAAVSSAAAQVTTFAPSSTGEKTKTFTAATSAASISETVNNTRPAGGNIALTPQNTPYENGSQSYLVLEKYYQNLREGQYQAALDILSSGFRKIYPDLLKYVAEQGVPDKKIVAVTPAGELKPLDTRIVYEVLLNVQLKGQVNSFWSDGNNYRWLEMVQENGNWRINQLSNTPISGGQA